MSLNSHVLKKYSLNFTGIFEGTRPLLYILDPELIKAVTIRDFDYFVDRNSLNSNEPRYLKQSLLNLKVNKGDKYELHVGMENLVANILTYNVKL